MCFPFLGVAGIQQNTVSLLWYFVLLLLYWHFGKKWLDGLLQKLCKSCCSCWVPAGSVEAAGSRASPCLFQSRIQPSSSGCTPAPLSWSAVAASVRRIQRHSWRFAPVSFSAPIFNSVSTDRCRQMWAHPACPQSQADSCQLLCRSHGAVWEWLGAQAKAAAESWARRSLCVSAQSPTAALESWATAPALQQDSSFLKYGYRNESKGLLFPGKVLFSFSEAAVDQPSSSPRKSTARARGAGCLLTSALALPAQIAHVYLPFLEGNGAERALS